jgi:GNAT superfamily N-acetyltransferase
LSLVIRPAAPEDAPLILDFIRELAEYEHLLHEVKAGLDDIRAMLFGAVPRAFCDIAQVEGTPVGFAFWFYTVSTFEGRPGLYLEDLYVRPEARGHGAGRALLASLARRCLDEGLARLEWAVLDWNAPAIGFYDRLGATTKSDWITRQLRGDALAALAALAGGMGDDERNPKGDR